MNDDQSTAGLCLGIAIQLAFAIALIWLWNSNPQASRTLEVAFFSALVFSFAIPFMIEKFISTVNGYYLDYKLRKVFLAYYKEIHENEINNNKKEKLP